MNGIVVDTRSSTDDSEKVLNDILALTQEAFGAVIKPARDFVSQIMFHSNVRLAALNPIFRKITDILTQRASADLKHTFAFEPAATPLQCRYIPGQDRPSNVLNRAASRYPLCRKHLFLQRPLRTAEHLDVLKAFEDSLLG